jgi:hypothetical protein
MGYFWRCDDKFRYIFVARRNWYAKFQATATELGAIESIMPGLSDIVAIRQMFLKLWNLTLGCIWDGVSKTNISVGDW